MAREIKIYANIIIGGRASWSIAQASDCEFTNNTCINPTNFVTRVLADDPSVPCTTNVIKNNIFYLTQTRYFNGSAGGSSSNIDYSTHTYQNNLFYYTADGSWTPNPTAGVYDTEEIAGTVFINNLSGNPLFANISADNYQLQSGSAAISNGASAVKPNVDYYGMLYKNPRSVGASEYNSTPASIANHNTVSGLLSIYPNPTSDFIIISANKNYKSGNARIEIFDINGRSISSMTTLLMNTAIPINISELNNGSYFIRLSTELGNWQQKFVVVK